MKTKKERVPRYRFEVELDRAAHLRVPYDYVVRGGKAWLTKGAYAGLVGMGEIHRKLDAQEAPLEPLNDTWVELKIPQIVMMPEPMTEKDIAKVERLGPLTDTLHTNTPEQAELPGKIRERVAVTKLPFNTSMVICGQRHVWVGNASNFVLGMELEIEPHPGQAEIWRLVGPLPSQRGRW